MQMRSAMKDICMNCGPILEEYLQAQSLPGLCARARPGAVPTSNTSGVSMLRTLQASSFTSAESALRFSNVYGLHSRYNRRLVACMAFQISRRDEILQLRCIVRDCNNSHYGKSLDNVTLGQAGLSDGAELLEAVRLWLGLGLSDSWASPTC